MFDVEDNADLLEARASNEYEQKIVADLIDEFFESSYCGCPELVGVLIWV